MGVLYQLLTYRSSAREWLFGAFRLQHLTIREIVTHGGYPAFVCLPNKAYIGGNTMAKVPAFHTTTDPTDEVYHVYDDCPAGEVVIANGNDVPGENNWRICDFCDNKNKTGKFTA